MYQTVAHALLRNDGGEEVLFIHSNGKDAAKTPVELLRTAGTPVCAVVDFDILNSEQNLIDIVSALSGTPPSARILELRANVSQYVESLTEEQLMTALRGSVQEWLGSEHGDLRRARKNLVGIARQGSKWDIVKRAGSDHFKDQARADVDELLSALQGVGLFVVAVGDLESWMQLKISKGQRWNRAALEQLHSGNCPENLSAFVRSAISFLQKAAPSP